MHNLLGERFGVGVFCEYYDASELVSPLEFRTLLNMSCLSEVNYEISTITDKASAAPGPQNSSAHDPAVNDI